MVDVSVLIVARNAEGTIGESIVSALAEPIDELLVVDDSSDDRTVEVVHSFSDPRIRVSAVTTHRTLGYARQFGLQALKGEFCFLLDADDRFLPGRVNRLGEVLREGRFGFVADEISLVDGSTDLWIRDLPIPRFLDRPPGLARLFERNYLPGIGQIAFQTRLMQALGYDADLHGVEDSDLVLRALLAGVEGGLVRVTGYQMRHTAGSVSRDRSRQNLELSNALRKHDPEAVRSLIARGGVSERELDWILFGFFLHRRDYQEASRVLLSLEEGCRDRSEFLEPKGPWPYSEGWRMDYARAALALVLGGELSQACSCLERALAEEERAELFNNWGVAAARLGRFEEAERAWRRALQLMPGFADARDNLAGKDGASLITIMPLRRESSRSEY